MKKIAGLILAMMLVLSLFACGRPGDNPSDSTPETTISETVADDASDTDSEDSGEAVVSVGSDSSEEEGYSETGSDEAEINDQQPVEGELQGEDSPGSAEPDDEMIDDTDPGDTDSSSSDTDIPKKDPSSEENDPKAEDETEWAFSVVTPESETTSEASSSEGEDSWIDRFLSANGKAYMIVSMIVMILLLAIIVVLIIALRSSQKRKADTDSDDIDGGVPAYPQDDKPVDPTPIAMPNLSTTYEPDKDESDQGLLPVRASSVHHIGRRKNQEDSFGVSDLKNSALYTAKGAMAVVADGMGGLQGGENVSSLAVLTMLQGFSDMNYRGTSEEELNRLLNNTVYEVNSYLESTVGLKKSGSTLMAAIIHADALSWISVGDSRTALFRNGKLSDLNRRHVYGMELDEMVRSNRMSAEQARNHPDREKLTSYIGMGQLKYVDRSARPMPLMKGDRVILMSDGIFNTLTDPEIEQILSLPLELVGRQLEESVLKKANPHQDNFTAVVLEYTGQ